ncbi:AmmeMemoRadiSam system protein A [uncultured Adlercreutzia sp.]|uniref:AmmeMemoRadiSam system protein A n=1 Tax=uncultured Adlercreutzia sp. TaxID=875803 RepID=UPI0025D09533|nr:AmmeMemoRadiSam system protein A [uncultured Adlercreutzia sp.]MCI9261418.1 AmmeMemoRadiSam system protein A [Eggerthellaceae bacterium]
MSLLAAYAVPHPPLIVPAVGRGQEAAIADTIAAYQEVARRVAAHQPQVIVITSPHAPLYRDGFFIADTPEEHGSMAAFGQPQERITVRTDRPFADAVAARLRHRSIPSAGAPQGMEELDHATFVPLHFLAQTVDLTAVPVVRIGLSGLSDADHRFLGQAIAQAADALDTRCVLIASGDLSHKLKADGPYGFAPEGPQFDQAIADIFRQGRLQELFNLNEELCDGAAECGLRSFEIMAGALEGLPYTAELLSYEGPFGVGYGVAAFEVEKAPTSTEAEAATEIREEEEHGRDIDPLVALARASVESIVRDGRVLPVPANLPPELTHRRAGAFVSLHEFGNLRGCIGTIAPTRASLAEEIIMNGVAAATQDPRFPAVRPDELDHLSYSVDVLGEPEPVDSLEQLDPKRYGVIVSHGFKRGLLLPDLEGVDTVMDQIAIAKQKAGMRPNENAKLERFEVVRHTAGGEPRHE